MKLKFITAVIFPISILFVFGAGIFHNAYTRSAGAPAARCGSIADPLTCSDCHAGGPNTIQAGWITSDIPSTGYVSGITYNIRATATTVGRVRFGFEISPQSVTGTYLGTMVDTSTQTQIISTKYITHTSSGTSGVDSKTWAFNWTAPLAAVDSVTFYGAFLCSNNNNASSGDLTYKSSLTVHRDIAAAINDDIKSGLKISVFPNPATEGIHVKYRVEQTGMVELKLFDYKGRLLALLMSEVKPKGDFTSFFKFPFILVSGIYVIEISTETTKIAKRILVQQ